MNLLRLEQDVLGGTHPFEILHTLLGTGISAHVLSSVYLFFLAFLPISLGASLIASINPLPGLWWVPGARHQLDARHHQLLPRAVDGPGVRRAASLRRASPSTGVSAAAGRAAGRARSGHRRPDGHERRAEHRRLRVAACVHRVLRRTDRAPARPRARRAHRVLDVPRPDRCSRRCTSAGTTCSTTSPGSRSAASRCGSPRCSPATAQRCAAGSRHERADPHRDGRLVGLAPGPQRPDRASDRARADPHRSRSPRTRAGRPSPSPSSSSPR